MESRISKVFYRSILILLPIICFLICIGVGRYGLGHKDALRVLADVVLHGKASVAKREYSIIINTRLSRISLALICGGGLAVAGVALQSVFSNPLVSPDTLGVASGASFGAALALLFKANLFAVQISALLFGIIACAITYTVSRVKGGQNTIMLILSGIIVGSLFQAFVSMVKYVADTDEILPNITYWLMGSLYTSNWKSIIMGAPPIIICSFILFMVRWKTNVLSLSEDEAKSLGMNIRYMRLALILCSSVITSSVVSICGQIGWIGLLMPHMCRLIFGSDNLKVIPASISFGAVFLLICDTFSRSMTVTEVPVSILTALVGAPIFLMLLRNTGGNI